MDDPDQPAPNPDHVSPARPGRFGAAFRRLRRKSQSGLLGGLTLGAALGVATPPLDLRLLGRTLLHAALVGLAAGLIGAAFFAGLEYTQNAVLGHLGGYTPLRAHGESVVGEGHVGTLRPIVVMLLPAVGALLSGLLCQLAPEARGGGGDATIHAFHHQGGVVRRRVIWIKGLASILTLGTGGSGGREGPTMQIGASLGSTVGLGLRVGSRERRILMLAGVAAGMAAVFRTPLGAALLAAEVIYRDDFEAEALIPAILASVIAYSIVISIYGESTLFARAPRYTFVPRHLPLYALLAVLIAFAASTFLAALRGVQRLAARLPVPVWARPAVGGLALGLFAVPLILLVGSRYGTPGRALGILGGGYGAAQVAITGASWLPDGWRGAEFLLLLGAAKLVATSFTIGTGGSAGDFGPSLVLGGLFGGAFGRAAAVLLHDPSIDPGAFALVGMGTFYGGIAHVPVSALIMVSELAGSYDLLVPLMLAGAIAFVALRTRSLYEAQVPTHADSPVHRPAVSLGALSSLRVADVMAPINGFINFERRATMAEMSRAMATVPTQLTFPVVDGAGATVGAISRASIGALMSETGMQLLAVAADIMQTDARVTPTDDLGRVIELTHSTGLRQLPVVGKDDRLVGFVDEADVTRAYVALLKNSDERSAARALRG
ncbi:MAG TPA: chloride channel protein [Polyangia bacterium]|nr:chloride channel protein [Polyangia bacterium]